MTEPMASEERSRRRASGRSTVDESVTIQKLDLASSPVAPASCAMDANESPMIIE